MNEWMDEWMKDKIIKPIPRKWGQSSSGARHSSSDKDALLHVCMVAASTQRGKVSMHSWIMHPCLNKS